MKVSVKKSAVREFIREALGGPAPRVVNEPGLPSHGPPIDPSEASENEDTQPPMDPPVDDPEFTPGNSDELAAAADKLARRVEPELVDDYYVELQNLADRVEDGRLGETEAGAQPPQRADTEDDMAKKKKNVEEVIRRHVRRLLEIGPSDWRSGLSFSGYDTDESGDEESGYVPSRRNLTVGDVEGESLKDIAAELGFAAPIGAKAFIDRTMEKFKFLYTLREDDPQTFDKFMLMGTAEYIDYLKGSGELTAEEVGLLQDNPDLVQELPGFRDFLHKFVKRGMRAQKKGL